MEKNSVVSSLKPNGSMLGLVTMTMVALRASSQCRTWVQLVHTPSFWSSAGCGTFCS